MFGEAYYNLTDDLKFTGGLRFTDDKKHFDVISSWTLVAFTGYPVTNIINQEWREVTGRANMTWMPKLDFTDQSMFYVFYARSYTGGGANPPGMIPIQNSLSYYITSPSNQTHPATFEPEFNNAFELGSKNTLFDGDVTLNGEMAYVKNLLDVTHITGAFLSSDDTGLATNIFVTDPRLFGIRITKNW